MITDFDLQKGDGIAVDIIGAKEEDELWLVVDEDKLVEMIRIAFDCPKFTINDLIDALQAAETRQPPTPTRAEE